MKLNLLCLTGVVLGVFSIFINWRNVASNGVSYSNLQTPSAFFANLFPPNNDFMFYGFAFVAGTTISIFSPLGGFVQLPSALLVYSEIYSLPAWFGPPFAIQTSPAAGLSIALISASVVVVSLFIPAGTGLKIGFSNLRQRLSVFQIDIEKDAKRRIDVNVICLVGFVVGILSLALPWAYARTLPYPNDLQTSFDLLQSRYFVVVSAFIIGTVVSFFTPIAVLFQISGIILTVDATQRLVASFPSTDWVWCSLLLGFYLGIISIIIILIGILHPMWSGHKAVAFRYEGWVYDRISTFKIKPRIIDQ